MLFTQDKEWIKKGTGLFDVTMGCYDGAEICQFVGTFVLATITKAMPTASIGLCRDDGLGVLWDTPGSKADRIRKDLIKMFAEMGLKITIQTNFKVADFLDVTLNLSTRSFYPFRKPNDLPIYIHKLSNHPPNIIKNLPASISRRLTDISSDKASFADAKPLYDNALKASGYPEEAEYLEERKSAVRRKRRNRPRNITWFKPPFNQNVATNVGRKFRTLIRKHFPRSSKLYKIFNENTLKIRYSCMPNMAAVIRQHNSAVMRGARTVQENPPSEKPCNCRDKDRCPLNGVCQIHSIVYKATVIAGEDQRDYTGLTAQLSSNDFFPTSSLFGTRSTRAAPLCRSTSGPWKRTPILRSSGKCGRRPRSTRTQLVDAIYVSLRSWQSSGPTKRHRSTKDLSLCRNVAMRIAITCATFRTSNILKPVSGLSQHLHDTKHRFLWTTHQSLKGKFAP